MYVDRADAGRRLAGCLGHRRGEPVVVLGLPRGGVPVAREVAAALGAPLDVIVVRKLGLPARPEVAMGAIGEGGARVLDRGLIDAAGVTPAEVAAVEARERSELALRVRRYRGGRAPRPLLGRTVVVVDDGVATGATARVACRVARARGAARVVLAVPVAPPGWAHRIGPVADEFVCPHTPEGFHAVGPCYRDFGETSDAEVVACLEAAPPAGSGDPGGDGAPGPGGRPAPGAP